MRPLSAASVAILTTKTGDTGSAADRRFMAMALSLARRGLGSVWPNPAVGCVIVAEGCVVGRGWTQPGGRPHAETEALARASAAAKGATAYVSLEPCAHHGKTPPCTDALIDAGISRAVVALEDPDPRVKGGGIARLKDAGIDVTTGVGASDAHEINAGFVSRITRNRPLVTLKLATTLDGKIATHTGESRWITGEPARERAHMLRAEHDAVLVGIGTALADNPDLTCRLPGMAARSPVRVLVDGGQHLPESHKLFADDLPTWLITTPALRAHKGVPAGVRGLEIIEVPAGESTRPDLPETLAALAARGITRLLVEGGAQIAAGFVKHDLVDRVAWFQAPCLMGGDGKPAVAAFGVDRLDQAPRFLRRSVAALGADVLVELDART